MNLSNTQSKHIQILRGLAIIAVVFIHNTPLGIPQIIIRPFLNFCVGTFLFLSGLLSHREAWNPKKRIVKVLVPYAIWTFFYVCSSNIYMGTLSRIPIEYLKSLIFGDSVAIMYYIFVYCQFTLLIPIIDKLANSKYKYLGFLISPIEIILMRMLPIVIGYQNNVYLQKIVGISCLGWFTYFYLGYLIGRKKIVINYNNFLLLGAFGVSLALQMLEGYWYWSLGDANCGTQMKLSVILSTSIFVLLGYKFINNPKEYNFKILYVLGNYSFGIYFSHLAVMRVLSLIPLYTKYIIYPFNAIFAVIISLIMCYLGKKILKKYSWLIAL